jgi:hypothetical protein
MTAAVAEQSEPAPPPTPDWSALRDDVRCPLCDYDLRGLTEPRCPECGYRFVWADLTDPQRRLHPYLFEHYPRHNVWSFVRTMAGALRPRRFWSSLKPSQPSKPRRLLAYWLIAALLLPLGYAGSFTAKAVMYAKEHEQIRQSQLVAITQYYRRYGANRPPGGYPPGSYPAMVFEAGGPQGMVDKQWPPVGTWAYVVFVFQRFNELRFPQHLEVTIVLLAWPWLTLATLMIFRASMKRAKVNAVHVLRCVVYTGDAVPWLGLMASFALPPAIEWLDLGRYTAYRIAVVAAPLFALLTGWRLSAAYRHYLQFDRPLATAAAAQAIVLLVVWVWVFQRALGIV